MSFSLKDPTASNVSRGSTFNASSLAGLTIGPMSGISAADVLTWDGTEWIFGTPSSGGLSCVDGVVDGVGGSPGVYATLTAAAVGGARNICVTASYTESTTVVGTGSICISIGPNITVTFSAAAAFSGFDSLTINGCESDTTQITIVLSGVLSFCSSGTALCLTKCSFTLAALTVFSDDITQVSHCDFSGTGTVDMPSSKLTIVFSTFSVSSTILFSASFDSPNSVVTGNTFESLTIVSLGLRTSVRFTDNSVNSVFLFGGVAREIHMEGNRFFTSVDLPSSTNLIFANNLCNDTTNFDLLTDSTIMGNRFVDEVDLVNVVNSIFSNNIIDNTLTSIGRFTRCVFCNNYIDVAVSIAGLTLTNVDCNVFSAGVTITDTIIESTFSSNEVGSAFVASTASTSGSVFMGNKCSALAFEVMTTSTVTGNRSNSTFSWSGSCTNTVVSDNKMNAIQFSDTCTGGVVSGNNTTTIIFGADVDQCIINGNKATSLAVTTTTADTSIVGNVFSGTITHTGAMSDCTIGLNKFTTFTSSASSADSTFNGNIGTSMTFTAPTSNSITGNRMSGAIVPGTSTTNIVVSNRTGAAGLNGWADTELITVVGGSNVGINIPA